MLYHYRGIITSVYDGDTVRVDIDLGLNTWLRDQTLRLYGINAPELRGAEREAGMASRDYLRKLLPEGQEVTLETIKDRTGKYGRWLCRIWVECESGDICVNDDLVEFGFAEAREY